MEYLSRWALEGLEGKKDGETSPVQIREVASPADSELQPANPVASPQLREDSVSSFNSVQLRSCLRSPLSIKRRVSTETMLSPRGKRMEIIDTIRNQAEVPVQYAGTAGVRLDEGVMNCVVVLKEGRFSIVGYSGKVVMECRTEDLTKVTRCKEANLIKVEDSDGRCWVLYIHSDMKSASGLRLLDCLDEVVVIEDGDMVVDEGLKIYVEREKAMEKMYPSEERKASVNEKANVRNEYLSTVDSDTESTNSVEVEVKKQFRGLARVSTGTRFIKLPDCIPLHSSPKPPEADTPQSVSPIPSLLLCRSPSDTPSSVGHASSTPGSINCKIAPHIRAFFTEMKAARQVGPEGTDGEER
eukprot:TRINITY_DN3628_c0_g2_i1.p1 TRINITY_DN3628_c0_g2~~TRINITY_DN3628_c0_g2_i1.p1  ORF type:complete len:417 (+),score=102.66 TRINITY_DN3628_c0_g2_i1:185-1252(+)